MADEIRFRWKNLRGFEDTGWVPGRRLNIIIGPNNSGKSSFLAPLLLLKQTWNSPDPSIALSLHGDMINAGSFRDLVTDHDVTKTLEFQIDFLEQHESALPLGASPPSRIELAFAEGPGPTKFPVLQRFRSIDRQGRVLLDRKLGTRGYGLAGFERVANAMASNHLEGMKRPFRDQTSDRLVKNDIPINFMFDGDSIVRRVFAQPDHNSGDTGSADLVLGIELSKFASAYLSIAQFHRHLFEAHMLNGLSYIGPLRQRAKRAYEVLQEIPTSVGHGGERTAELIYHHQNDSVTKRIDYWMEQFGFSGRLRCMALTDSLFTLSFCERGRSETNIADCGFGISQVLPLVVSGVTAWPGSFLIAEQPEIHLNPKLQGTLADLFVDFANSGRSVFVETHSEHLLLRLRWLIAEGRIDPDDVALLYVEKEGGRGTIREVTIKDNGGIDRDQWPAGFFEDSMSSALGLASAQSRARSSASTSP